MWCINVGERVGEGRGSGSRLNEQLMVIFELPTGLPIVDCQLCKYSMWDS